MIKLYQPWSQPKFTCLKSTIETPEQCQWHRSGCFIVNVEHISYPFQVFILLILIKQMLAGLYQFSSSLNVFPKLLRHRKNTYVYIYIPKNKS